MSNSPHFTTPKFHSERLVYRAVNVKKDEGWLTELFVTDPDTMLYGSAAIIRPQSDQDMEGLLTYIPKALVALAICLPQDPEKPSLPGQPIGFVHLEPVPPKLCHHRSSRFGITLRSDVTGKGYGTEALRWLLRQAFTRYNLHRIAGEVFAFNDRALASYLKCGFQVEGRRRQAYWFEDQWVDEIQIGILEHEWRAQQSKEGEEDRRDAVGAGANAS